MFSTQALTPHLEQSGPCVVQLLKLKGFHKRVVLGCGLHGKGLYNWP